ncbi:hypothetical protein [Nesterenkonia sp. HG001]|uniref:hypothetical protein n=1 Tax=Nesterenkonia sp. HG001 TaxID=2983207 RepID=UPI002AC49D58|nr:hypothetical protein [Nesterenkonia sp. HG001]MDZ5076761.1 hypothetical protein [Nesterenkonia sp. HG001]
MRPTPTHLLPDRCYICGDTFHAERREGHDFWSNAEADAEFAARDAFTSGSLEARYVAEHRPY